MSALVLTLLGFFLPSQLGYHFWPSWSFVYGLRVDYLSPIIYLTDLLLLIIVFLNLSTITSFFSSPAKGRTLVVVGGVFVLLNIIFSVSPPASLIAWFRICLLLNLVIWLTAQPLNRLTYLFLGLSAGIIIVSSLALTEFALQRSVNSIFYYLGERHFDISTPGIARLSISKILLLRPYSTFGHPNALGGFALAVYLLFSPNIYDLRSKILFRLAVPFSLLALFLSFSKAAIITLIILFIFKALHLKPKLVMIFSLLLGLALTLLPVFSTSLTFGRSLIDRRFLIEQSIQLVGNHPLLGVGLGNFIAGQGKLGLGLQGSFIYLQPVHNLFLLLFSEIGILGTSGVIYLLYNLIRKSYFLNRNSIYLLSAVILTGSLDHYWLTLQQPRLLLAVVLGLILNSRSK